MRILLATPMMPRPQAPGAIPILLHAELMGLAERHEVTLATVAGPEEADLEAADSLRARGVRVHVAQRTEPYGLARWQRRWRLASTWLRGRYPWRSVWYWEPGLQHILDRLLAPGNFDVLQVEDNAMGVYQYPTDRPKVLTEHEVRRPRPINWRGWPPRARLRWLLGELDWQRWRQYQVGLWRRFDRLQVFGARDARLVQQMAADLAARVRLNPFCVEIPPPLDLAADDGQTLLFVGNYYHPPNVDAALWLGREIMPPLRQQALGARLLLVGLDPPPAVRALAAEDVVVTGQVPRVEPYLAQAAVVVAPVRIGGGQRMKVLHSMAAGKAVVTTALGADGLRVGDAAPPLMIADDAAGIAAAVAALIASPQRRQQLGAEARAYAERHFSPAAYAGRLEAVYGELLAGDSAVGREVESGIGR